MIEIKTNNEKKENACLNNKIFYLQHLWQNCNKQFLFIFHVNYFDQ